MEEKNKQDEIEVLDVPETTESPSDPQPVDDDMAVDDDDEGELENYKSKLVVNQVVEEDIILDKSENDEGDSVTHNLISRNDTANGDDEGSDVEIIEDNEDEPSGDQTTATSTNKTVKVKNSSGDFGDVIQLDWEADVQLQNENDIIKTAEVMEIPDTDPFSGCSSHNQGKSETVDSSGEKAVDSDQFPIVVNDTKSLVSSKKEPGEEPALLVIIDTNAILSGKGPVPLEKSPSTSSSKSQDSSSNVISGATQPANLGDGILLKYTNALEIPDDAFLTEAPSFIVPYVFEQSGEKSLKDAIKDLEVTIRKTRDLKLKKGEELDDTDDIIEIKKTKSDDYFDGPVGKLLMNVGMNLVQEHIQVDLLKMQKRKAEEERDKSRTRTISMQTQQSILSLKKNIEESKENNEPFRHECRPPEPPPKINRRARPTILTDDLLEDGLENSDEEDDYRDFKKSKQSGGRRSSPVRLDEDNKGDGGDCEMCGFGGQVICCDQCPRLYHLLCLDSPKTRVPRGSWYCPECSNSSSTKRSKKGSKKKNKSRNKKKKVSKRGSRSSLEEDSDEEETAEDESEGLSDDDTNTEEDVIGYNDESGEENVAGEDDVENKEDGGSDEDEKPKMKVKFGGTSSTTNKPQMNSGYGTRSSGGGNASGSGRNRSSSRNRKFVIDSDNDDEESQSEEEVVGRGKRKSAASAAAVGIAQVAKRLQSDSKENDSSENSNDSNPQTSHHSRKRSYDSDSEGRGGVSRIPGEGPKRTRLQRMNTNQCSENGELDNVLLDRLLTDVMKHGDAWPFLKPVTKVEAPDYHEIVKHPMDLGTIKYKLNSMVYTCNEEFISDLSLVFSNCLLYNEASHAVSKAGKNLRTFTERRCSKLGIHFSEPSLSSSVDVNYN